MRGVLVTAPESDHLNGFEVTTPAAAALIAQGWTPPEEAADD